MTFEETMKALETMGTAQNRKILSRHGGGPVMFGVSFANLGALKKKIKVNHELARKLWATGNTDAQSLATLIADAQEMTEKEVEDWARQTSSYLADLVSGVVHSSRFATKKMKEWTASNDDALGRAGWGLVARAALHAADLHDSIFERQLAAIEKKIHKSKNRTRHAMNGALIAIGLRNERLQKLAIEAARRIGKVVVDHGETACETPGAESYILKRAARARKKKSVC